MMRLRLIVFSALVSCSMHGQEIKIRVGHSPGSVEISDFNHDHFSDLAVTSETDSSVTILLGNGKGEFRPSAHSPFFAGSTPNDICISDFNNDGNPDLSFANHEKKYITVLLGDGTGNFNQATNSPFKTLGMPHVHGIAAGDFNGDHRLDLVTDSWGNDQIEILLSDGVISFDKKHTFFKVGKRPYQRIRVGDINKDGIPDIVTTNTESNNATVLLCDGQGNFKEPPGSPFPCGDNPFGVAIGDVNADGNPDLAIINSPGSMAEGHGKNGLTILLGDGMGKFSTLTGSPFESGKIPNRIAIGDVNGDGVNDIVTSDNENNQIYLFIMSKSGSCSTVPIQVGNHPKGIAIHDLNGDGKADIVVCNNGDNDISILIR